MLIFLIDVTVATVNSTKAGRRVLGGSSENRHAPHAGPGLPDETQHPLPHSIAAFGGSPPLAGLDMESCKAAGHLNSPLLPLPTAETQHENGVQRKIDRMISLCPRPSWFMPIILVQFISIPFHSQNHLSVYYK